MIPYNGYETSDYPYHPHSHPHTLAGDHSKIPRIFFKVPRVVPDQRDKFETEEIFKKNARDMEVRYTLFRDRPMHERQAKFIQGCRDGHVEVSHSATGLVLVLSWNPLAHGSGYGRIRSGCDLTKEPGKVHIRCSLIINGVCVLWTGWLDTERLDGVGSIDFDPETAKIEDDLLQQQVKLYDQRMKEFEDHQRRQRDHLQQIKKLQY